MRDEPNFSGEETEPALSQRSPAAGASGPRYPYVPYPAELAFLELRQDFPSAQIRILMLRRLADPLTGEFETTTAELARLTRAGRSAVQKALRALERARFLHVRHIRTRRVRLIVSFGGFPHPRYLREGKPPLLWDEGFRNGLGLALPWRHRHLSIPADDRPAQLTTPSPEPGLAETRLLLKLAHSHLLTTLDKGVLHLRANVILPVGTDRLKVVHTYNMDEDQDRGLEFRSGSGAAGRCWDTGKPVVCDLEDARATFARRWKMSQEQQARVHPSLCSLISVPILGPAAGRGTSEASVPLGILSFDSDEHLLRRFRAVHVQEAVAECATVVGNWLGGRTAGRL